VREAIAGTAVAEVGALGLGLVLKAVLTTAVADATGILAASLVAALGLTIIPYRRSRAVDALRARTAALRTELRRAVAEAVDTEIALAAERMTGALEPYSRFVRAETERVSASRSALDALRAEAAGLRRELAI
jgi:hypothetical protein